MHLKHLLNVTKCSVVYDNQVDSSGLSGCVSTKVFGLNLSGCIRVS